MTFIPHTPESLISRSDSKNPATTCKGITSSGRPCRRALAASNGASPSPSPRGKQGVLAVLPNLNNVDEDAAAAFFCWQHKDQAQNLVSREAGPDATQIVGLQERTSIDTIADRLGLLDVEDNRKTKEKKSKPNRKPVRKSTLPKEWQEIQGPLINVPKEQVAKERHPTGKQKYSSKSKNQHSNITFAFFCCGGSPDKEFQQAPRIRHHEKVPRHQEMIETARIPTSPVSIKTTNGSRPPAPSTPKSSRPPPSPLNPSSSQSARIHGSNSRPPLTYQSPPSSETSTLLSLLPPTLSPQITSTLLTELAKPLSTYSSEPGYIYIFWLTPTSNPVPDAAFTSSLLQQPAAYTSSSRDAPRRPKPHSRSTNDILRSYSVRNHGPNSGAGSSAGSSPRIVLKIGRATNVQRRLNEWTRQCNHNLSLIRYYPYHPTSPLPSPSGGISQQEPRKVHYVQRVERLIHLELAERRVKRMCSGEGGCGKEHREWFEVDGSREGIRGIDEAVRRWVRWGERLLTWEGMT